MELRGQTTLHAAALPAGVSLVDDLIIHVSEDGAVSAAPNRCRHQGGRFGVSEDGCTLVCSRHGWVLDPSTWSYLNPVGGGAQPTLVVEHGDDGELTVRPPARAGLSLRRASERQPLEPGELVVEVLSHACVLLACGDLVIATDPWLFGPAFLRGWWLRWQPPDDAVERIAAADLLVISHSHPDHLHVPTLQAIGASRPDLPVLVPDFGNERCEAAVRRCGFSDVRTTGFDHWFELAAETSMLLFQDGSGREDSGFVVDHRGHIVVNTVDCPDPAAGSLPTEVDVLLSSYAGGSSGYPVCWGDLYDDAVIEAKVSASLGAVMAGTVERAERTGCRVFIPFAGSFTEAHPADAEIVRRNRKNAPADVVRAIGAVLPQTIVWVPSEGARFDVGTGEEAARPARRPAPHDIERWDGVIARGADHAPLRSMEGIERYFEWAGFRGDLVLHVIETDMSFSSVVRDFLIDFLEGGEVVAERPDRAHRYLRMRVRSDSFRYVLRLGLSWEELSIGFQARFYREPDRYNFDFWDHFQNGLPAEMPW